MRRRTVGKVLAGVGMLVALGLSSSMASAAPTCSSITTLPGGSGILPRAAITSGTCIAAMDKLYGNFNLGNLPTATVLIFNFNTIGANDYYQLAFSGTYQNGTTYDWSYEMAVNGAPPGTVIVQLDADFTQTAGGPSTLTETITPAGSAIINEVKVGAIVQPGSVTQTFFTPGASSLLINMHLVDHGSISSVTNTVVQFVPDRNIPEPLTLSLFGAGLAGASLLRRRRRS